MDGKADQVVLMERAAASHHGGRFDLATLADDAEIRRLLCENAMDGAIRLSLEPAPGVNSSAPEAGELVRQVLVGRRRDAGLFGMGVRSVRQMYVIGSAQPVGYLGGLRMDQDHRHRPRALVAGYERLRELHDEDGACRFYLTSIMSDNVAARRVLEAGLPGMPTYRYVGDFVTLVMRVRRGIGDFYGPSLAARRRLDRLGLRMQEDGSNASQAIAEFLQRNSPRFQFASAWTNGGATFGGARLEFRQALGGDGRLLACAALWDRRSCKRTVVRGYCSPLARWRWAINLLAGATRRPRLPAVGQPLELAYVSHATTAPGAPAELLVPLVEALHAAAAARGIDYLVAGFAGGDERLAALRRRFGGREFRSRLYVVYWPDGRRAAETLDGRPACPEVALL